MSTLLTAPPDMSTAVNGIPTKDIFGNALVNAGQCQYPAIARNRSCFIGDGVGYWNPNSTIVTIDPDSDSFEIEYKYYQGTLGTTYSHIIGSSASTSYARIVFNNSNFIFQDDDNNSLVAWTNLKAALTDDSWHTIKFIGDGTNIKSYHNGVLMDTLAASALTGSITYDQIAAAANGNAPLVSGFKLSFFKVSLNGTVLTNYQFCSGNPDVVYDVSVDANGDSNGNHLTGVNTDNSNIGVIDEPDEDYLAEHGANFVGQFNGVDDYVLLDSSIDLDNMVAPYIEFRFKPTASGGMILGRNTGSWSGTPYLWFHNSIGRIFQIASSVGSFDFDQEGTPLVLNVWYKIKFIQNGTEIDYYVDDVLTDSQTGSFDNWVAYLNVIGVGFSTPLLISGNISYVEYGDGETVSARYNITGIDSQDTFGTWSGTGNHISIVPALSDGSADVLGQSLVYGQDGRQLIPETYLSMPSVRELYDADQADRYEGGLMDSGKGTFTEELGDELLPSFDLTDGNWASVAEASIVDSNNFLCGTFDFVNNTSLFTVGRKYKISVKGNTLSTTFRIYENTLGNQISPNYGTGNFEGTFYFTASATDISLRGVSGGNENTYIESISVKEVLNDSDTESWVAYGNNTIENEDDALKVSYVDNANGAYLYLREIMDLNTDLIVDDVYLLKVKAKVNAGSSVALTCNNSIVTTTFGTVTNTEYEWFEYEFVAGSATACHMIIQLMSAGEIIWIDQWELFHKTTQTGNNLITNGGARNEIGALITTDWIDSDSDGLADGFTKDADNIATIVTGNEFSSNAQRIESSLGTGVLRLSLPSITLSTSYDVFISFKYRTNRSDISVANGLTGTALASNTGDAVFYSEQLTPSYNGSISTRLVSAATATAGDYLEVDELEVRPIMDSRWFEPEAISGDPVIVATNDLLTDSWRYLTEYVNTTDRKDLMLLAADNDLTYEDHQKIIKYLKEDE